MPPRRPSAGMCARRRSIFLLRRQEKDTKEKATPLSVSPSGQPAVRASGGVRANSLHCVALKQRAALIRLKLCSSARPEGTGTQTALRAIAALGPSVSNARGAGIGGAVQLSDHDFAQRNSCSDPNPGTVGTVSDEGTGDIFAFRAACLRQGRVPGCAPGGAVTFSCVATGSPAERKSPKRRRPRCPCPLRCATGQPAVLASGGVRANSLRSNSALP